MGELKELLHQFFEENPSLKKPVFLFFGVLILLVFLVAWSLISSSESNVGLLKPDSGTPDSITTEDRDNEYQNREELPEDVMITLDATIESMLSKGEFEALDKQLKEWSESYKDNEDAEVDESIYIENYRADLSYYLGICKNDAMKEWYFRTPDSLAAAVAYAPVSKKYLAMVDRDSALFAPARGNISLSLADLTSEEHTALLDEINARRTGDAKYLSITVYDMNLFGYSCRFIAGYNQSYYYEPYSLHCKDQPDEITMQMAEDILLSDPRTDLDDMFAAPDDTDVYPTEEPKD